MGALLARWRAWRRYLAQTGRMLDNGTGLSPQAERRERRDAR